jgi:hypothetical protein
MVLDQIPEFKDQLFVTTASGKYLDRIGANYGIRRPNGVGMKDEDFRDLIPILSYAPKQLRHSIQELLRIWYGDEKVYANVTSTASEPFNLTAGTTLTVVVDGVSVDIDVISEDYADVSAATAEEFANAVNKQSYNLNVIGSARFDPLTDTTHILLRTNTLGATGTIQVSSGGANSVLNFPTTLRTINSIDRAAVLYEVNKNEIVVILPSSPGIVRRNLTGSAHLQELVGTLSGPYVYDPNARFTLSALGTTLSATQDIVAGSVYTDLEVEDLPAAFPRTLGHFVLDFGNVNQEGPVKYLIAPNDNALIVDPAYVFQKDHATGATLQYVRIEAPQVAVDGSDYAAYITGVAIARVALRALIQQVSAVGVSIRFIVLVPEYRFSNPSWNTNEIV